MSLEDFCPVDPMHFWRETRWKDSLDLVRFCTRYISPKMSLEDFCPVNPMPSFNFGANHPNFGANRNGWSGLRLSMHSLLFRQKCPLRMFAWSIPCRLSILALTEMWREPKWKCSGLRPSMPSLVFRHMSFENFRAGQFSAGQKLIMSN